MAEVAQHQGQDNLIQVDRKVLLFQLDLSAPEIFRSLTGVDLREGTIDGSANPSDFKFIDPVDYENVASPLYWRNAINDSKYKKDFKNLFAVFQKKFFSAVQNGLNGKDGGIILRRDNTGQGAAGSRPFIDITELVRAFNSYSVQLGDFDNRLSLILGAPETLSERGFKHDEDNNDPQSGAQPASLPEDEREKLLRLYASLQIGENDVIMVRTSREGGNTYELEFLGFVTKLSDNKSYGQVNRITLVIWGMSKLFFTTNFIRQAALSGKQVSDVDIK